MRFAMIGAGGYIAPRHARAIRDHGGELVLACDTHDSVGYLDSLWPDCKFETNPNHFFAERLAELEVTHVVVCTPNYLHVTHARQALDAGCHVVLEKPTACRGSGSQSAEVFQAVAKTHPGLTVYPIVQLRYDPGVLALREHVRATRGLFHCEIDYQAFRGDWYRKSWKGRSGESGGLLVNLGVHLVDLCCFLFGPFLHANQTVVEEGESHVEEEAYGTFRCDRATVAWRLSIRGPDSRRVFSVAGRELDLSNRITALHSEAYDRIWLGEHWELDDVCQALHAIDRIYEVATRLEPGDESSLRHLADRIASRGKV